MSNVLDFNAFQKITYVTLDQFLESHESTKFFNIDLYTIIDKDSLRESLIELLYEDDEIDYEAALAKEMAKYSKAKRKKKIPTKVSKKYKSLKRDYDDSDVEAELQKAMDAVALKNRPVQVYTKATLLAVADKNPNFNVYCEFIKRDKSKRIGNFRICGTRSQITLKQDTIIVFDTEINQYRTIPLDRILKIEPI